MLGKGRNENPSPNRASYQLHFSYLFIYESRYSHTSWVSCIHSKGHGWVEVHDSVFTHTICAPWVLLVREHKSLNNLCPQKKSTKTSWKHLLSKGEECPENTKMAVDAKSPVAFTQRKRHCLWAASALSFLLD